MTPFLKRLFIVPVIFVFLPGFGSGERLFAPGVDPWPRWEAHDPSDTRTIDHSAWTALVQRYLIVDDAGPDLFRYAEVSAEDRAALTAYLDGLAATPISTYNRNEQLAYWANLYNALTVQVILDHFPVASIRDIDISPGFFADGPWGKELITVEGEALSLNDVEHRIMRPVWRDPRIHYIVNCASIGCPDLYPSAFAGAEIEQQMTAAAKVYVNDPRGVTIEDGKVIVSKIYDWFIEDFGGDEAGVLAHLRQHAAPDLQRRLRLIDDLHGVRYDWALNAPKGE